MTQALRRANAWFDRIEGATLWQIGPPTRRLSWFQIAWTGLHVAAAVMHALSVIYHARRVRRAERLGETCALHTLGAPGSTQMPLSMPNRRTNPAMDGYSAAS
jgi:hypothetical protein